MDSSVHERLSLWALTAMVVGSMIGAGIFSLPASFARATGPFGALVAWLIAGVGMLMLAFVFQSLSSRKPDLDAGVYAYAKAGFGNYLGFSSALGYWAGTCLGNVTYFVLIGATLSAFFPAFGDGSTPGALIFTSLILWGVHFLILRGVKEATAINTLTTVAKIIPLVIFVVLVIAGFDKGLFTEQFWGGETPTFSSIASQVRSTMLVTVFVFLGIEGANVYSRYARNRRDVGLATVLGFLGVLCLLILVTVLPYGILPREAIGQMRNPTLAGILQHLVGTWGSLLIVVGLLISVLGAYLSWSLLAAEVLYTAAHTETMPRFLARQNQHNVPVAALWLTNITVQVFLALTLFAKEAYTLAAELTSSMNLIPYLLVAAYALKLALKGETYESGRGRTREMLVAGVATLYAAGLIYAGGLTFLLLSALLYGPGTLLFIKARREQGQQLFTPLEWMIFGLAMLGALLAIYGLATGLIEL